MLGKVPVHLDPRPFAPSVKSTGLIQCVYESFDILVLAAATEPFHCLGKLSCSGCIIVQQPIPFLAKHHGATTVPVRRLKAFEAIVERSLEKPREYSLAAAWKLPKRKVRQIGRSYKTPSVNKRDSTLDFVRLRPLKRIVAAGSEFWCVMAHKQISTPICGHYRCLRCNRVYPVLWEQPDPLLRGKTSPTTNHRQRRLAEGRLTLWDHLKLSTRFDNDLREYDISLLRVREKVAVLHDLQRVLIDANGRVVSHVSSNQQFALVWH